MSFPGWNGTSWAKVHELPHCVLPEMSYSLDMNGGVLDCVCALGV